MQQQQPEVSSGLNKGSYFQNSPSAQTLQERPVGDEAPPPDAAYVGFSGCDDHQGHQQPPPTSSIPSASHQEAKTSGRGPPDSHTAEAGGVSVLVVEDEPINRKIMVRMLRKLLGPSATIYEAADGTEAVDLCTQLVSSNDCTSDTADNGSRTTGQDTSLYGSSSAAESPAALTTTRPESVIGKAGSESTIHPSSLIE
ncbi:hypothetical protein HK102_004114, partial [Quaeritorhiza haematococci]